MATARLIKTEVERIPMTEKGQVVYIDTNLPGFWLCAVKKSKP
jgi:hypothetical protein